jgi:hypothetical protein
MELSEKLDVLRVKAGDVLVLRMTERVPAEGIEQMRAECQVATDRLGVKFVILDERLEVVAVQEA